MEYGEEQREALEVALSRFDGDMDALESSVAEQRRVMIRMLDAMRSDTFAAVREFLPGREESIGTLAAAGSTDPAEIGRAVQPLRAPLEALASDSPYVRAVLECTDESDRRLLSAAPPRPRAVAGGPRTEAERSPVRHEHADGDTEGGRDAQADAGASA